MKNLFFLCIICILCFDGNAQSEVVSGIITDSHGPLPDANILVEGTSNGTQTDFDGNFTIKATRGDVLVVSYIGYKTRAIEIKDPSIFLKIELEEDSTSLDEVVVVGYSVKKRRSVTAAISYVSSNQFQNNYKINVAQLVQGKAAGIQITNKANLSKKQKLLLEEYEKTGNNVDILYIVDGKPIAQANNAIIEGIHPHDIVKKHIYKPTRAKQVFGISGKMGCVLIETKQGDFRVEDDESYAKINENKFVQTILSPLSTFSIDVDKASYSNIRRMINNGQAIKSGAVKIEEMVNYFDYQYQNPTGKHPFGIHTEVVNTPWNKTTKLVKIGIQGKTYEKNQLPPSNLTFLIDVSGSMGDQNKLPLLKSAFKLLVNQLRPQDKVSIVVYAGAAGVVLEPTSGADKRKILEALDNLEAGGSTAGGAGIKLAYKLAANNFIKNGNNRVILATDGDFNVGASSDSAMEDLIIKKRNSGIFLSVLGFGMGNYKDSKLETLADKGNGNHAYIDTMQEARKIFGKEMGGTLHAIAKDVKIQVEFNPALIKSYRLIGYENRMLEAEDFTDDTKDAGELGSGHSVTALYEVIPVGIENDFTADDIPLKYSDLNVEDNYSDELLTVKFRYKKPKGNSSIEIVHIQENREGEISSDLSFAASVALFGMHLRESSYTNQSTMKDILQLAENGKGMDQTGCRAEFINLVKTYYNSL
ncbi:MAG: von Willebrand factor type A domain-containing protein [Bacteroidota bacterium]